MLLSVARNRVTGLAAVNMSASALLRRRPHCPRLPWTWKTCFTQRPYCGTQMPGVAVVNSVRFAWSSESGDELLDVEPAQAQSADGAERNSRSREELERNRPTSADQMSLSRSHIEQEDTREDGAKRW